MQYSQEHLKTMVYAEFWGANRVYYGQLENREWLCSTRSRNTGLNSDQLLARALFQGACLGLSLDREWLSVYNKHECKRIFPGWLQGWEDWIHAPSNPLVVGGSGASQHPFSFKGSHIRSI